MARLTKAGQLLNDVTVKFQVYLERLKAGEVRRIDSTIRQLDEAIRSAMSGMPNTPTRSRMNKALKAMRKEMLSITDAQAATYMKTLREFSNYALGFHTDTVNLVAPPNSPALTPAKAASWAGILEAPIQATGSTLEPFVKSWGARTAVRVESAVRLGYAQGQTTQQIVQRIRGTKANNFTDGILGGVTKREASAMVRTSLQHVNNQAQQMVYDDNSDIIEGYIWISTLDSRTSTQCRSLDGQFFKMGKGPVPPIHVNCRSSTIPKVKGVDLLSNTTRATKDGQVPADMTYYEWLKTQSPELQDEVLGKTRAAMFRDGGITPEQFANANLGQNFEPLTLDQMKLKLGGSGVEPEVEIPAVVEKFAKDGAVAEDISVVSSNVKAVSTNHFDSMDKLDSYWYEYENANAINQLITDGEENISSIADGSIITGTALDEVKEAAFKIRQLAAEEVTSAEQVFRGSVFADFDEIVNNYAPGDTVRWDRLSSASITREVADIYTDPQFAGLFEEDSPTRVIFDIRRAGGVRGHRLTVEDSPEVILPAGSEYQVLELVDEEDVLRIIMEQVYP